jgi:hypothetical protein
MTPQEMDRMVEDARPRMCWRVGISGHIKLEGANLDDLKKSISEVFDHIDAALVKAKGRKDATLIFSDAPPLVAVVSPLAEGADRIFAELAVARGYELRTPLPFEQEEYERDFPNSVKAFQDLLLKARAGGGIGELYGRPTTDDERNAAYLGVGKFVVRNCDLLVAVWNGKEAGGTGGTEQIVNFARRVGVPVVHIASVAPHTRRMFPSRAVDWLPYDESAQIDAIVDKIMPRVRAPRDHDHDHEPHDCTHADKLKDPALHRADVYFRGDRLRKTSDEPDYLYLGPFAPRRRWYSSWMWPLAKLFPGWVWLLGRNIDVVKAKKALPPCGPDDPTARYLFLHHQRADALSTFYSNVHRGTFLLVYFLAALALSFAVASLEFHEWKKGPFGLEGFEFFTGLELITLLALGALVWVDNAFFWRDRWLEYRLLAELLREADLLAQVGRPMPMARIDDLAQDLPGRAWVTIAYSAIIRRAGIVTQKLDDKRLLQLRDYAADTRLQDQIAYHLKAEARNEAIGSKLRLFGALAFGATIVVAFIKLIYGHDVECWHLGLFAGILPALAYAFFGIRNQAEFEIVSRRSERMIAKLCRHKTRIKALEGKALTAAALSREILKAADAMRHDAADWTSIFEVKETEP